MVSLVTPDYSSRPLFIAAMEALFPTLLMDEIILGTVRLSRTKDPGWGYLLPKVKRLNPDGEA